jgi:hypothetical protein
MIADRVTANFLRSMARGVFFWEALSAVWCWRPNRSEPTRKSTGLPLANSIPPARAAGMPVDNASAGVDSNMVIDTQTISAEMVF